ncbi:MAG: hypothetical protein JSS95_02875 [Acidobacteria bacterium]|nr:hypothetical protein [Acidobacteriota bacterium]
MTTPTEADSQTARFPLWVERGALVFFLVTLVLLAARSYQRADELFITPHAFVSADVATTARTFATEGIIRLHGVPVNNNPPITVSDAYTHWPPLLPASLAIFFRTAGPTERTAHLYILVVFVATAILLYLLGKAWLGSTAGALTAYFWLTLPVVLQFRDLVAQQALMMMFVVAALLAFEKGSSRFGFLFLLLAVVSAWEAALVAPVMWLVSIWFPGRRRQANVALAATGAGLLSVAMLFLYGDPQAAVDTIQTAKFYMGLSDVYSHSNTMRQTPLPVSEQIRLTFLNNFWMLGALGLAGALQLAMSRPAGLVQRFVPLAGPWIAWCVLMSSHTARHHFEFLIAAPAVAVSLAWIATKRDSGTERTATVRAVVFVVLAAVQAVVLPHPHISDGYDPVRLVEFGKTIKAGTPPGSIVLAPLISSVPLYYSERHIVRGVDSPQAAMDALQIAHRDYPGAPVYLAIPPFLKDSFQMEDALLVGSSTEALVFKLK